MDEVSPEIEADDLVVDGSDGNPLYTLIDGLIDAGTLELFSVAPYWRLKQTTFPDTDTDSVGQARELDDGKITTATRTMIRLRPVPAPHHGGGPGDLGDGQAPAQPVPHG